MGSRGVSILGLVSVQLSQNHVQVVLNMFMDLPDVLKRHSTHIHVHHKGKAATPPVAQSPTVKKRKPLKRKLPPTIAKRDDETEETCTVSGEAPSTTSTAASASASGSAASNSTTPLSVPQNVESSDAAKLQITSFWTSASLVAFVTWITL